MNTNVSNEVTPLLPPPPTIHMDGGASQQLPEASLQSSQYQSSYRRGTSWENYVAAVEKYPIRTKCITALIIFVTADAFAQVVEYLLSLHDNDQPNRDRIGIDWIRAMRFGALGLFGAPWSHYYFYWLDHFLPPSEDPFTTRTAVKVVIDQFIQAPILLAIMIGQRLGGAKQDLSNTFMASLIANCMIKFPCVSSANACQHLMRSSCFSCSFNATTIERETLDSSFNYQYCFCQTIAPSIVRERCVLLLDNHS
jgi:hypothetical protein